MKTIQISVILLVLGILLGGFLSSQYLPKKEKPQKNILTLDEAKAKAKSFINDNLMPPQSEQEAKIESIVRENDLYKLKVDVAGQKIDSYLTLNGKTFFPSGLSTEKKDLDNKKDSSGPSSEVDVKKEKPQVELFVMSHCPYGVQMEKAILPVVKTLGDKIDFQLKFCDYAMHREKELKEQLRQHCIKVEQSEKLIPYLDCFAKEGKTDTCLSEAGIDKASLGSCVEEVDQEYKVTENFKNKDTWKNGFPTFNVYRYDNERYKIGGSPALVINNQKVQVNRSPSDLLSSICSAFTKSPSSCESELSSEVPMRGFGEGVVGGGNGGGQCQ